MAACFKGACDPKIKRIGGSIVRVSRKGVPDKWAVLSQGGVNNMGSLTLAAGQSLFVGI